MVSSRKLPIRLAASLFCLLGCSDPAEPAPADIQAAPGPSRPGFQVPHKPIGKPPRPFAACVGHPKLCDDGNDCTIDVCHPFLGCSSSLKPSGAHCDDTDACTTGDSCTDSGTCEGTAMSCEDDNACTTDHCVAGACLNEVEEGAPCDDGNACTSGDSCSAGAACVGHEDPIDDDNECTADSCDEQVGVLNEPVSVGIPCTGDENICDGAGTCITVPESLSVVDRVGGQDDEVRERRLGLGRHPVAVSDEGFAVTFLEELVGGGARVGVATYTPGGAGLGLWRSATAPLDADPVVAAVPGGFVVAMSQLDVDVDSDGLGISLIRLDAGGTQVGAPVAANQTMAFGQHSPDIHWDGASVVVGWEDDSMTASWDRRVCTRAFTADLAPLEGEQCAPVAGVNQSEVVLEATSHGLASAWREETLDAASIEVRYAGHAWTLLLEEFPPTGETAALVELDATHLLVVYTDGWGYQMEVIVDSGGGQTEPMLLDSDQPRFEPMVAKTEDGVYLGWRESIQLDDVMTRKAAWDGSSLSWVGDPIAIPNPNMMCAGDQNRASLVSEAFFPTGALIAVWNDRNPGQAGPEHGDVLLSVMPTPIVRPLVQ
jgi:Dictyostelium (slime mold) repeat